MFSITQLEKTDLLDMYQTVQQSQNELEELGWIAQAPQEIFCRHYAAIIEQKKLQIFAIKVDGRFAGVVEIADRLDHFIIGYWLGKDYRRQGIATESVKSVLNQIKSDKTIKADTLKTNPASARILEKNNFILEKTNEKYCFYRLSRDIQSC